MVHKDGESYVLNGEKIEGAKLCFEACALGDGKKNHVTPITWYHPEQGEIRKISQGLSVGGKKFLMSGP